MAAYAPKPEEIEKTPRARELSRLAAYQRGTQYDGRPDFFAGTKPNGEIVPLRERKPCVIDPLPRRIVRQAARFTFGEGRFPKVKVHEVKVEDATAGVTLSADDAATIERLVAAIVEQARLRQMMRALLETGLAQRSAVAVLSVREGKFEIDAPRPEHCWPAFAGGNPRGDVESLTWCYRFDKLGGGPNGPETKPHFYRRDFTATQAIAYQDAEIKPGVPVEWAEDSARTTTHGLGFCPVVWMRNQAAADCGDIDGTALCDGLEDECDALNFALSQRHRGIHYFGTPQPYETGVDEGDGPGATGRTSQPLGPSGFAGRAGAIDGNSGSVRAQAAPFGSAQSARVSAPDEVWSYEGKDVRVGLVETTGASFEAATKHVNDITARILQSTSVVLLNPAEVAGKGDMSAKFLAMMYQDLLALVDDLRDGWWSDGLARLLNLAMRMIATLPAGSVTLPGADKARSILRRFLVQREGRTTWAGVPMEPVWGAYFSPSNAEIKDGVAAAAQAKDARLISAETATRYIADDFGVRDPESEVEEVEEESADALAQQHALLAAATTDADAATGGDAEPGAQTKTAPEAGDPKPPR